MTAQLTQIERVVLAMHGLAARVNQLQDDVTHIRREMEDALGIWRSCACFGLGDESELEDEDGNPVKPQEDGHDTA